MSKMAAELDTSRGRLPAVVKRDWPRVPLGAVAQYINGRAFKPRDWGPSGWPIIRIKNLTDRNAPFDYFSGEVADGHRVNDGDLLVSWSATLDAFIWNGGPAVVNQHIFKVVEDAGQVDRRYLYYALREAMAEIDKLVHGATMKHVTKPTFERHPIAVPPLAEQRRVAAWLTRGMKEGEAAREAAIDRLTAAEALTAAHIREVFDERHAWPTRPLGEIVEGNGQYGTSQRSNTLGRGLPILGMPHIHEGRIRWRNLSHADMTDGDVAKYRLVAGDILFNRTNSAELVGKTAVFDGDREAVFASYLIRYRARSGLANPHFVSAYVNSRLGRIYIERHMARAIGQVNISASTMHRMPVPCPPYHDQCRIAVDIARRIGAADEVVARCREELAAIDAIPSALLREAFGGPTHEGT